VAPAGWAGRPRPGLLSRARAGRDAEHGGVPAMGKALRGGAAGSGGLAATAALIALYLALNVAMNMLNKWALGSYGESPPASCARPPVGGTGVR